ncbi:hypothetical protein GCM10017562_21680 [Streptomyces roseofulvus]
MEPGFGSSAVPRRPGEATAMVPMVAVATTAAAAPYKSRFFLRSLRCLWVTPTPVSSLCMCGSAPEPVCSFAETGLRVTSLDGVKIPSRCHGRASQSLGRGQDRTKNPVVLSA